MLSIVSKSAKLFFRKNPPQAHWHVGVEEWTIDTFRCLTDRIDVAPHIFFSQLMEKIQPQSSDYSLKLRMKMEQTLEAQDVALQSAKWSENVAFSLLLQHLPQRVSLHLSNGLTTRLGQRFPWSQNIRFFSNRGTSGIDGATSTAVGYSAANAGLTVLLSGDISFLYDSNALWNDFLSSRLKMVTYITISVVHLVQLQKQNSYKKHHMSTMKKQLTGVKMFSLLNLFQQS